MKKNQIEVESEQDKLFITFNEGRPHIVHKDKTKGEYRRIDHPAVHYVRSESRPNKLHMVVDHPEGWICTCESWQYHGECKHIKKIKNNEEGVVDPLSSSLVVKKR